MITTVDTNTLLALLYEGKNTETSEAELRRVYQEGRVVITPIVYTELAADGHFDDESNLNQFLEEFSLQVVEPSREVLFQAGEQFHQYAVRQRHLRDISPGIECLSRVGYLQLRSWLPLWQNPHVHSD
ncbi:type II toxin-antitoxin system VapC family toxin [Halovenus salina]|uniref:Type II toxin-antitoxin system VapC family toxin n=1 Tax=Halovenus salina TaxID=1510225 RepID=A0ABD5W3A6_9EURY|nr:type II toxin-antitoxin system VapC family toxin [Halovenus salina]